MKRVTIAIIFAALIILTTFSYVIADEILQQENQPQDQQLEVVQDQQVEEAIIVSEEIVSKMSLREETKIQELKEIEQQRAIQNRIAESTRNMPNIRGIE